METNNIQSNDTLAQEQELPFTFRAYDSQLPIAVPEGMRVVKCLYKVAKTGSNAGKAAGENSYILVSQKHLAEEVITQKIVKLAPYVAAFLQAEEDKVIKEFHKNGGKGFGESWLSLSKILEALDTSGQSSRLNKEKIETWFTAEMQEALVAAFAEKLGVSEVPTEAELEKLAQITSVYKGKFTSLASGKTMYREEEATLMQKALEVTGADQSVIGSRFNDRLERMKVATPDDLLLSL